MQYAIEGFTYSACAWHIYIFRKNSVIQKRFSTTKDASTINVSD